MQEAPVRTGNRDARLRLLQITRLHASYKSCLHHQHCTSSTRMQALHCLLLCYCHRVHRMTETLQQLLSTAVSKMQSLRCGACAKSEAHAFCVWSDAPHSS